MAKPRKNSDENIKTLAQTLCQFTLKYGTGNNPYNQGTSKYQKGEELTTYEWANLIKDFFKEVQSNTSFKLPYVTAAEVENSGLLNAVLNEDFRPETRTLKYHKGRYTVYSMPVVTRYSTYALVALATKLLNKDTNANAKVHAKAVSKRSVVKEVKKGYSTPEATKRVIIPEEDYNLLMESYINGSNATDTISDLVARLKALGVKKVNLEF